MSDSDLLIFADEAAAPAEPWIILIVDDEPGVHDVTRCGSCKPIVEAILAEHGVSIRRAVVAA